MNFRVKHTVTNWWKTEDKQPTLAWTVSILGLLLICWLAFFWNLGNIGLIDETEPLFAEAARQMTVTGDWITPYFNGETRFDKPPLVYWLMAIGYQTLGVNEWAVRLPSAVAAMALTALGFYTLRRYGYPSPANQDGQITSDNKQLWISAGLGAALIALNPLTIAWARTGVSDMLLTGCMDSALLAFFLGYAQPSWSVKARWYLAFYVLLGLAILAKGPVGIVLPGLIIAAFLLYLGNVKEVLREIQLVRGLIIVSALAVPWYVLVIWRNGEAYIDSFFGYHNLERFTSVVNGHDAPWYFYFLVVLLGFTPWSIYLPAAMARLQFWQRQQWQTTPRSTQLGLFALFWFLGIFGFFTVAVTKLPSYVLPLMPAGAILVALLFTSEFCKNSPAEDRFVPPLFQESDTSSHQLAPTNSKLFSVSILLNVVFLLVLAAALFYAPEWIGKDPAIPKLRRLIRESGLTIHGAIIWGMTAGWTAWLLLRHRWRWVWSANLVGFVAFIIFVMTPAYFLMDHARQLPLRELSAIAAQELRQSEELIMIGFKKPSVVFYSQKPVIYYKETEPALAYIEQMAATQPNPPSVLILSYPKRIKRTGLQPQEYQNLGKAGAYQLIRVSKQVIAFKHRLPPS